MERFLFGLVAAVLCGNVMAASCELPKSLKGKSMFFDVSEEYTRDNPGAGKLMKLMFMDKTYKNTHMQTGNTFDGSFRYSMPEPEIGIIKAQEMFAKKPTSYMLMMVCKTNVTGIFVYSQQSGDEKDDIRQNTGVYTIAQN